MADGNGKRFYKSFLKTKTKNWWDNEKQLLKKQKLWKNETLLR